MPAPMAIAILIVARAVLAVGRGKPLQLGPEPRGNESFL